MTTRTFALTTLLAALSLGFANGFALRTVGPGDVIGQVAGLYNVPVDAIMEANGMISETIHPGDVLRIPLVQATGGISEAAPEPPPGFRRHVLAADETLSEIVGRYDIDMRALVGANPDLSSLDRLPIGVELLIPPGDGLLIQWQPGDELVELVRAHGADPVAVLRANAIVSPSDLRPGMLLFLPGVEPTAAIDRLAAVREAENRYIWPVHGRITSYFGRRNLGFGTSNFHRGLDVGAPTGTPILAARSGTVSFAGWSGSYGYLVRVRHAGNEETWYAHQSAISVSVGQAVDQGQILGRVGSTGLSTGPHLHFELRRAGTSLDPLGLLR